MTTAAQQRILDSLQAGAELFQGRMQGKFWLQKGRGTKNVPTRIAEGLILSGKVQKVGVDSAGNRRYT